MSEQVNYLDDFGPFDDQVWINCSHQGALPRVAAEAARVAVSWKTVPHNLYTERFQAVPARLRRALGDLVRVPADEIILANSASYGLHLMANGLPWRPGDEVLVVKGDFPSDILPWLGLEKRGVKVRFVEPRFFLPSPEELEAALKPETRVFCSTWVHSFSGAVLDLAACGEICRRRNVLFFINASQALGAMPLDLSTLPVDAVTSVGFKYLCGPYGTGFLWVRPDVRDGLEYNQAYWLSMMTADDLGRDELTTRTREELGARAFDVFGTANFFNFMPWTASVEYLLAVGINTVRAYDRRLIDHLADGIDPARYELVSPRDPAGRSNPVVFTHRGGRSAEIFEELKRNGVHGAFRRGAIRLSPHLYNTDGDVDRALAELDRVG